MAARYSSLVRTGFLLMADRGHAEDLVQSALLKTYSRWRRLAAPETAEAYTRSVMVRLALRWRKRRWRGEHPTEVLPDQASASSPADEIARAEAVRKALWALPVSQRAVLVLRYYEDRSEAETAALLGCSVGTVKSRASRALAALRQSRLLEDEEVRDGRT